MNKNNLISTTATVTLPASEYYALIKLTDNLIKDRDTQLEAMAIEITNDRVQVKYSDIVAYGAEMRDHVVKLLVANDDAMEALVRQDEYHYEPRMNYLSSYSWCGPDLREAYPEFGKAWQDAVIRINNRAAAELTSEAEQEANDESEA